MPNTHIRKLISIALLNFMMLSVNAQSSITGFEVKRSPPSILRMGEDTSSMQVYYYKDITMYRLSYEFSSTGFLATNPDNENETLSFNTENSPSRRRYHYVLFKQPGEMAFDSFPNESPTFKRSAWKPLKLINQGLIPALFDEYIYGQFNKNPLVLKASVMNKDSGITRRTYEHSNDTAKLATYYFTTSDRFPAKDISLSKGFDSLFHSRLYECRIVTYKAAFQNCDFGVDELVDYYLISPINGINNEAELMGYFTAFEKKAMRQARENK